MAARHTAVVDRNPVSAARVERGVSAGARPAVRTAQKAVRKSHSIWVRPTMLPVIRVVRITLRIHREPDLRQPTVGVRGNLRRVQ